MVAKISFTVYQDYEQFLTEENDYDYGVALKELNKHLTELVEKNELAFKYGGKEVKPILPLTMNNVGNIFGEDFYDGANWDGVDIPCEIDVNPLDFEPNKFRVNKHPHYLDPRCILH